MKLRDCNFQTTNSKLELKITICDFYFTPKSLTSYENWNVVGFFVLAFFCLLVRILAHRSRNHELRTVQKTSFHGRYFRRISGLAGFHGLPHVARLGHWPYFAICYRESVGFVLFYSSVTFTTSNFKNSLTLSINFNTS